MFQKTQIWLWTLISIFQAYYEWWQPKQSKEGCQCRNVYLFATTSQKHLQSGKTCFSLITGHFQTIANGSLSWCYWGLKQCTKTQQHYDWQDILLLSVTLSSYFSQAQPVMCFRKLMCAWLARNPASVPMDTWLLPECFVPVTAMEGKMPVRYKEIQAACALNFGSKNGSND